MGTAAVREAHRDRPPEGISERLPTGSAQVSPEGLVLAYDMKTLTPRGGLRDFSGQRNHGTVVGTDAVPGPFGGARRFRQASDFIRLPSRRSLHVRGPLSIATWVKLTRLGVHQHIVAYDDLYTMWIDDRDRIRFADTRGDAFESEVRPVDLGAWCAVVATFGGGPGTALDDGNIALYVNGHRVAGRAFGVWNPGRPVEGYIGKESHEGQFYLPLHGEVASVLIFRRPLSAEEALAFAEAPGPGWNADLARGSDEPRNAPRTSGGIGEPIPQVTIPPPHFGSKSRWPPPANRFLAGVPRASSASRGPRVREPPRVVRITNLLPPYRLRTLEILEASPLLRFETWLMAASERSRRWDLPASARNVRVFRDWGLDLSHRNMVTAHFNPGMFRELSRDPPDLVILGGYDQPTCLAAGLLLDRMKIPFVLSSESISLEDSLPGRWAPFLVREVAERSAAIIVPGMASRGHFLHLGIPANRIFVAPNAVDVDRFVPAESPEEKKAVRDLLGLPDGTLCLCVGRLTEGKGIPELLDAFRSLRPRERGLHLIIVGDGPLRPAIESRMSDDPLLQDAVSLVGYAPEELLPKYHMASDIFVFPTRRDIWGLVLNEAMAAGLPVVSSDGAGAALDLIEDGVTGVIVPRGQADDLAAAILRLHENPELRRQLGQAGRERVLGGFTPPHHAMGFLQAITTTLRRLGRLEGDREVRTRHGDRAN